MEYIPLVIVVILISLDKYSYKKILVLFIIVCLFILSMLISQYRILIEYLIFIVGAKNVSLHRITKVYLLTGCVLLIITIISAKMGIIENLIYIRNGKRREAFGVGYPTDFAAHIFYLIGAYLYLRGKNTNIFEYIVLVLITMIIYRLCDTRLDCICMIIAIIFSCLYKRNKIKFNKRIVKNFLIMSCVILSSISIYTSINYKANNKIYIKVNEIISNRLYIGKMMYDEYGVTIFGQKIDDHGFGGSEVFKYDKYNFIDCSYMRILLKYGIIAFIIVIFFSTLLLYKFYKNHDYLLVLLFVCVIINSVIAQHFIDFSYNYIILFYMAKLNNDNRNIIKDNTKKIELENYNIYRKGGSYYDTI